MGVIAAFTLVLATQKLPTSERSLTDFKSDVKVSPARLNEIWDHIDNRFVTQQNVWFEDGNFPACVAALKVQSAYSPDDYELVTSLGWMLENIERYDETIEVYLDFGRRHPKDPNAVYPAGFFYYQRKDYAKCIKILEPTLALNPGPNTYRTLAKAFELNKRPADAIRIWELELKRFPNEGSAVANIKRVKAKMAGGGK